MKTKLIQAFVAVGTVLTAGVFLTTGVQAQNSSLIPPQILEIFGLLGPEGTGTANFITSRTRTALFIALGVVVLVAVVYALFAAFRYIQSQGDPGKIEEAQKAIKAIFMGVAAMLIGIVGIVLVYVFLGSSSVNPALNQVCISAPNSPGCQSCIESNSEGQTCLDCNKYYADIAAGNTPTAGTELLCTDP